MRLSLGCLGVCWVAGFAGLLPVFSGILVSKSLIINGISFAGNGAFPANVAVVVAWWFWGAVGWVVGVERGCRGLSGFAGLLPMFSGVLVDKSLIINGISFSSNCGLPANVVVVAWG